MKKYLLLLFVFCVSIILSGQEKPTYEKKTYVSPEGKLYLQHDLGIYLWLSTSDDSSAEKHLLQSEESKEYTNPMYLDTDGYNSVRSPSAVDPKTRKPVYPLRDIVFEIYSDEHAPVTKIDYGESKPFVFEGKTYVMSNTKVELKAKDDLSGTMGTFYSMDGGAYVKYSEPLVFSEEREYTLKYYSVDNVGNDEEVKEITYIYDKTAPTTKKAINTDGYNNIVSARSTIELSAEDKGVGVKKIVYKINDGNEYTYTQPLRAGNLSQGEHTVSYYAVDKVGNKENTKTYTFYVDKTAPTIIEEVIGKSFFANGREFSSGKAQLKLTAFDNKAGVKEIRYSINGGEYQLYTKPVFLTQSSGNLVIKTYAVDNVNNKSTSQTANEKTAIPYIDLSGPTLSNSFTGPKFTTRDTLFINSKTKLTLKARDLESGVNRIEYSINGGESKVYGTPITLEKNGVHTISYIGYDNVENTSSAAITVKVDNDGPIINHQFSTAAVGNTADGKQYPKYVMVFLAGTDNVVGLSSIKYSLNNGSPRSYSVPITGFATGAKLLKIIAADKLGNVTEQEVKFDISD
ncbi:MAG TPA: hypothetical protein DDX98_14310 [Bacteroidales bacterium]|nr:hypothetical protein [Bacteroidales bacterium]